MIGFANRTEYNARAMFGTLARDLLGENYEWLKREESSMPSQLARFTFSVASIYPKSCHWRPGTAGRGGCRWLR